MLRKENETLKCAQENQVRDSLKPDSSEPSSHSSPKQNNHNG